MIIGLLCGAMALAAFFPETPAGKSMRRLLIELPAQYLNLLARTQGLHVKMALVFAVFLLIVTREHDVIGLLGPGLGEAAGWFLAFDVTTAVDLIAITLLVAAAIRLRALRHGLQALAARARTQAVHHVRLILATRAARKAGRSRQSRSPSGRRDTSDDKDGLTPALRLALA
jgi:uncharacterized protein (DUF3820 family)